MRRGKIVGLSVDDVRMTSVRCRSPDEVDRRRKGELIDVPEGGWLRVWWGSSSTLGECPLDGLDARLVGKDRFDLGHPILGI